MRSPPRRSTLLLAVSLALVARAEPVTTPARRPVGPLLVPSGTHETRTIGPVGTLGADVYRRRRKALVDAVKTGVTVVVNEARWDFVREGMDFYYLTGIDEPGAVLVLDPKGTWPETLFLRPLDVERGRWEGEREPLPSQALEDTTGIAHVVRTTSLPAYLLRECDHGGLNFVGDFVAAPGPKPPVMQLYADAVERAYECKVNDHHGLLSRQREAKAAEELSLMRRAVVHTAAGHQAILQRLRPGLHEYDVKDAAEDAMRRSGSRHVSYDSIVGSGPNGAVLHYPKDDRVMKAGDLLVADVGAEEQYYASDVTRTYPVGGTFTAEQRQIYDLVLKAQAAAIAVAKPGVKHSALNKAALKVIDDAGYHDAAYHDCCHFVGLEVHDPGDYEAPLPVGAVLTVEPGIYLPERGFGVRIEDEIVITPTGAEVLTKQIPKGADEIERLMAGRPKP